jgi:hypothetical protein
MTAAQTLTRAASIMADRATQYDQPGGERSMGRIVAAFNAVTGRDLNEAEGWLFMLQLKLVRSTTAVKAARVDSLEDAVAYAALLAEAVGE